MKKRTNARKVSAYDMAYLASMGTDSNPQPDWVTIQMQDGSHLRTRPTTWVTLRMRAHYANTAQVKAFVTGVMENMPHNDISSVQFWWTICSEAACVEIVVRAGKFADMRTAAKLAITNCAVLALPTK